jgi:hypothetical protein
MGAFKSDRFEVCVLSSRDIDKLYTKLDGKKLSSKTAVRVFYESGLPDQTKKRLAQMFGIGLQECQGLCGLKRHLDGAFPQIKEWAEKYFASAPFAFR